MSLSFTRPQAPAHSSPSSAIPRYLQPKTSICPPPTTFPKEAAPSRPSASADRSTCHFNQRPIHLPDCNHCVVPPTYTILSPTSLQPTRSLLSENKQPTRKIYIMSRVPNQPYSVRPTFAPLQSANSSQTSTFNSTSSVASQSSLSSAPSTSPSSSNSQQQQFYGSLNTPQPRQQMQPQRHPSFDYLPNRQGAGQSAGETSQYLDQMALLAEAAKRAQIACVMRDIEGMEL